MFRVAPAPRLAALRPPLVAPAWHTALLIALLLAVAFTGLAMVGHPAPPSQPAPRWLGVYLPLLVVHLGLSLYVCRLGLPRSIFSTLLGARWHSLRGALADVALASLLALFVIGSETLIIGVFGDLAGSAARGLLPSSSFEKLSWVGVAACVACAEELVYRGYLQRQLATLTGRVLFGVLLQALLFGLAHGEQGLFVMARFAVYGVCFGALADVRGGLLVVILAHAGIDIYSGFAG